MKVFDFSEKELSLLASKSLDQPKQEVVENKIEILLSLVQDSIHAIDIDKKIEINKSILERFDVIDLPVLLKTAMSPEVRAFIGRLHSANFMINKYAPSFTKLADLREFLTFWMIDVSWQKSVGEELLVWWDKENLPKDLWKLIAQRFGLLPSNNRIYLLERSAAEMMPLFKEMIDYLQGN